MSYELRPTFITLSRTSRSLPGAHSNFSAISEY